MGRYISLERVVEESKETYYEVLLKSSNDWHEPKHDLRPWWEYFLGTIIAAYKEFEERVGTITTARGAKREMVGPSQHHSPGRKPTNTLRSLNKLYNKEDDGKYITAPSTDLAKAWDGWGTGLKPAWEPIILARKPIDKGLTIAKNVAKWGTGGINIGACRVGTEILKEAPHEATPERVGRFPANLIHDGSDEVLAGFPITGGPKAGRVGKRGGSNAMHMSRESGDNEHQKSEGTWPADTGGSAARFFYCAKCSRTDRDGSNHPCMKPTKLLQYLCRLITPPNGLVLDPFCGSGSTGKACTREGFQFIGIEKEAEYCKIAKLRVS